MNHTCDSVRPLLFAALERQLDSEQRIEVNAHLAVCDSCRSFERAERALNDLLFCEPATPARTLGRRVGTILAIAGSIALLLLILPAATPRGSIVERELTPTSNWLETASELADRNRLHVPRNRSISITLADASKLEAVGPARFNLVFDGDTCEVTVLEGDLRTSAASTGSIVVVNDTGRVELATGTYTATTTAVHKQDPKRQDPGSLIAEGQRLFFAASAVTGASEETERANMRKAEKLFSRALEHPNINPVQRNTALFYLSGAQGRLGEHVRALETGAKWLKLYPNDPQRSYVLFFQAVRHERLGDRAEATRIRRQILAEDPTGQMAPHVRAALGMGPVPTAEQARAVKNEPIRTEIGAGGTKPGPYLVVRVALDEKQHPGYVAAAAAAAKYHDARSISWDGRDFDDLRTALGQHAPENVLFVLRPETLDINLHRQILLRSATLDDDIFVDFAFGYLTAKDGASVRRLWKRIEGLHERGLASKEWRRVSITSSETSLYYDNSPPAIAASAGFQGSHSYVSYRDVEREKFVDKTLRGLQEAAVIQFTGNGDPQGIWVFDDHRNIDRSKHWQYAAEKVGHDPDGEMPRIMASEFAALELASPIVWSGTCHSGATCRVFVEGDIVSTFGRTDVTTVHELAKDKSLALAWLEAGAASLLVPIAANHGMSVSMETDFMLRHGASLGETIKSTYDDVFMAAGGKLELDIAKIGTPHGRDGYIMQGGGANRILIGDPALRPFQAVRAPVDRATVERTQRGLKVTVERNDGFTPRSWDIFGDTRPNDWRVITRADVTDLAQPDRELTVESSVKTTKPDGSALPYALTHSALENYHGKRFLHLQANGPRSVVERKGCKAVFEVRVE